MFYVAAVLVVLSGLFYAASHHEIGTLGRGNVPIRVRFAIIHSTFWSAPFSPRYWGAFVSIR